MLQSVMIKLIIAIFMLIAWFLDHIQELFDRKLLTHTGKMSSSGNYSRL